MDGGAWWAAVHGVAKSWTQLNDVTFIFQFSCIGGENGNPLQCHCLENPRDGGAWWAAIYGVAQSWTQLKRFSSSSSVFPDLVISNFIILLNYSLTLSKSHGLDTDFIRHCDGY